MRGGEAELGGWSLAGGGGRKRAVQPACSTGLLRVMAGYCGLLRVVEAYKGLLRLFVPGPHCRGTPPPRYPQTCECRPPTAGVLSPRLRRAPLSKAHCGLLRSVAA